MKHLLSLGLLLLLSTTTWSQDTWVKVFGGGKEDFGWSLTKTSDGGFTLTGSIESNDGDFKGLNKGGVDIFVIKLNSNGEILWKKTFGGSGVESGHSLTTTEDGGMVLTGETTSNDGDFKGLNKGGVDIYVIKLNSNGDVVWKKTYGGRSWDEGTSLTTTKDGGMVLTGWTVSNDGDFKGMSKGKKDIFIIKLNSIGKVEWMKTLGGNEWDYPESVTTTEDGGIVLTGETESNDGDFKGMRKGGEYDGFDIFIIKLNSNGEILWKKTFGGSDSEDLGSLTTTSDGGFVLTGSTRSNDGDFDGMNKARGVDIFVIKLNSNGEILWKKTFGGSGVESGHSLTTTEDGGMVLTGETTSNDGDFKGMNRKNETKDLYRIPTTDIFVIKLDENGRVLWKKTVGGSSVESGTSLTTTEDGGMVLMGFFHSNDGDFDGMNKDHCDIFIMKLDKDGNLNPPKK